MAFLGIFPHLSETLVLYIIKIAYLSSSGMQGWEHYGKAIKRI